MMWAIVIAIAAACFAILVTRLRLDTEILNLLPRGFPSVEGLKVYNNEFEQTRELTFALLCQPEDIDKLEEFAPKFVERLHSQPWCVRVLAGSPLETPQGIADLQQIFDPSLTGLLRISRYGKLTLRIHDHLKQFMTHEYWPVRGQCH